MAINKVVNGSKSSRKAMNNVIQYVLRNDNLKDYVAITGPYFHDDINSRDVYQAFLDEKKTWHKDGGRMYSHNIISFHKNENITAEECLEIGQEFVGRFFKGYQNLIALHQDKDHLHVHIVTNSVSFLNGKKLHQSRNDLQRQKDYTNQICKERGFTVTEKGKHFDGSKIEEGCVRTWNKDKYNHLKNDKNKSYLVDCVVAVINAKEKCSNKEEFIIRMAEQGWSVSWTDIRKYITFTNEQGKKTRCIRLSESFNLNISKAELENEFERYNSSKKRQFAVEPAIRRAAANGTDDIEAYIRENDADRRNREDEIRESANERANRDQEQERLATRIRKAEEQRTTEENRKRTEAEATRIRAEQERITEAQRKAQGRNKSSKYDGR